MCMNGKMCHISYMTQSFFDDSVGRLSILSKMTKPEKHNFSKFMVDTRATRRVDKIIGE